MTEAPETPRREKPLILMVDDIPQNLQVLTEILMKGDAYEIAAAAGGAEALEAVEELSPDLVLLDIMMPGMDGFEVCRRLKASPRARDIPIIFLTAMTQTADIVRGFEEGAVDYVTKPFNATELLARVRTHLQVRRLIAGLQEALAQVKQLSGLVPICAHCKKIRDDKGFWDAVETYIENHSDARFTHGICPDCVAALYPAFAARHGIQPASPG
ncbi:MAG: response regulator [Acidobacteria bacterium]|nr:response regulator [Acidobacteriota bacterium]